MSLPSRNSDFDAVSAFKYLKSLCDEKNRENDLLDQKIEDNTRRMKEMVREKKREYKRLSETTKTLSNELKAINNLLVEIGDENPRLSSSSDKHQESSGDRDFPRYSTEEYESIKKATGDELKIQTISRYKTMQKRWKKDDYTTYPDRMESKPDNVAQTVEKDLAMTDEIVINDKIPQINQPSQTDNEIMVKTPRRKRLLIIESDTETEESMDHVAKKVKIHDQSLGDSSSTLIAIGLDPDIPSLEIQQETVSSPLEIQQEIVSSPLEIQQETVSSPLEIQQETVPPPLEIQPNSVPLMVENHPIIIDALVIDTIVIDDDSEQIIEAIQTEDVVLTKNFGRKRCVAIDSKTEAGGNALNVDKKANIRDVSQRELLDKLLTKLQEVYTTILKKYGISYDYDAYELLNQCLQITRRQKYVNSPSVYIEGYKNTVESNKNYIRIANKMSNPQKLPKAVLAKMLIDMIVAFSSEEIIILSRHFTALKYPQFSDGVGKPLPYRFDQEIDMFLKECCQAVPRKRVHDQTMYDCYVSWYSRSYPEKTENKMNQKVFSDKLKMMIITSPAGGGFTCDGWRLKSPIIIIK